MAAGDVHFFNEFLEDEGLKIHNLNTDTVKLGLITSAQTPAEAATDPRWGAGGTVNYSTAEVSETTGNYAADGPDITNIYSETTGTGTLDATDVSIAANANNPTAARWGILYNSTSTGKECIAYIDLGSDIDMTAGLFTITWAAAGIGTKTSTAGT